MSDNIDKIATLITDIFKIIADFLSKASYRLIILFLIFLLSARIEEININNLLTAIVTGIESIEVGKAKVKYKNTQTNLSEINSKISLLCREIEKINGSKITSDVKKELSCGSGKNNDTNSKYTVLVYYRDGEFNETTARDITRTITEEGYKSSAWSDSIDGVSRPPGTIRIIYTDKVDITAFKNIRNLIENQFPKAKESKIIEDQNVSSIDNGDIQVQVF